MTIVRLPLNLSDGAGFLWDIQSDGSISNGTSDAFDGGFRLANLRRLSTALTESEEDGREIAIGPFTQSGVPDIRVERKVYVPNNDTFARFFDSITNTGDTEVTYRFQIQTNLGSDGSTNVVGTSSDDLAFTTDDIWIVTDDWPGSYSDPAVAHVFGNGSGISPAAVQLSRDDLIYRFDLTLAPGETQSILHFGVQRYPRDVTVDIAEQLAALGRGALDGLSSAEVDQIVNFDTSLVAAPLDLDGGPGPDLMQGRFFGDMLDGFGGNDTILGESGDDSLSGGDGDDSIDGGRGSDIIDGGDGNDTITGGSGNDSIAAGAGNDSVTGGSGSDSISAGDGNDSVTGDAGPDTISGDGGMDTVSAGDDDDYVTGDGGDDIIFGDGGNDTLLGGADDDSINGGQGSDVVFAGTGNDTVYGDTADATVSQSGNDRINGMDGDDLLMGGHGEDTIAGQSGNDTITGGGGFDLLFGGDGDDFIFGGYGSDNGFGPNDRVWGGDGADKFFSAGVRNSVTQIMDYHASEGDQLVVDGVFFEPSDFELYGVQTVRPDIPGLSFRPTELVRLDANGKPITLFTFGPDFTGDSVVLRLAAPEGVDIVHFDFF
ncbi:MAG: hypothetical protein JXQ79_11205 [Rhodobacteraceae bacterium]|nr:hypothetical protein [Paracoccaceae bacterium]